MQSDDTGSTSARTLVYELNQLMSTYAKACARALQFADPTVNRSANRSRAHLSEMIDEVSIRCESMEASDRDRLERAIERAQNLLDGNRVFDENTVVVNAVSKWRGDRPDNSDVGPAWRPTNVPVRQAQSVCTANSSFDPESALSSLQKVRLRINEPEEDAFTTPPISFTPNPLSLQSSGRRPRRFCQPSRRHNEFVRRHPHRSSGSRTESDAAGAARPTSASRCPASGIDAASDDEYSSRPTKSLDSHPRR